MPTGYTAGILDGSITTFEQYAKVCARAFGGFVHMKDESIYAPLRLPEKDDTSKYHEEELVKTISKIKEILSLDFEQLIQKWKNDKLECLKDYRKMYQEKLENKRKLEQLYNEVLAWQIPNNKYINYKQFMLDQLSETIKHDGDYQYYSNKIIALECILEKIPEIEEIREELLENLIWCKEYHTKALTEQKEIDNDRYSWGKTLLEALDNYDKQK